MAFQDVLDLVTWNIARPDLGARIQFACINAVNRCHNLAFFQKDLTVVAFQDLLDSGEFVWEDPTTQVVANVTLARPVFPNYYTSITTPPPLWRRVHQIRTYADLTRQTCSSAEFKDKATDPLYDDFKRLWANHYLQLGTNLRINFATAPVAGELEFFKLYHEANIEDSFMVQEYPEYVARVATASLATLTGNSDLGTEMERKAMMDAEIIVTTETTVR